MGSLSHCIRDDSTECECDACVADQYEWECWQGWHDDGEDERDAMPVFRCVVCWRETSWAEGCADDVDTNVGELVDQTVFADRAGAVQVSDGGVCDGCWFALGADALVAEEVFGG